MKSFVMIGLAIGIIVLFFSVGIPLLARFAIFLGSSKGSVDTSDRIPPASPRLAPVDEFTNKDKLSIRGFTEAGVDVELYLNGEKINKILSDNGGEFLFSEVKLASSSSEFFVKAIDKNNNISQPSGIIRVTLDKVAPKIVVDSPKEGQVFSGQDKKLITVGGKCEEGVSMTVNGRTVYVDSEGRFETTVSLLDGPQEIKITAADKAGNASEKIVNVTFNP